MPIAGKNRTVDASRFAMVPRNDVPRSAFTVQHGHKTTLEAGFLIPVYVDEVLPGDSFRVNMTAFARLATPIVPIMDNLWLESFFFYVPCRLVWDNWARFMGEQLSPTDTTAFLMPYTTITDPDTAVGSISDYFGLTVNNSVNSKQVNALPFRAYRLIWDEWFRDQDLQTRSLNNTGDGPDVAPGVGLLRRGKKHDYFTSARPWPEKPINQDIFSHLTMDVLAPGRNMTRAQAGAPVTGLGTVTAGPVFAAVNTYQTGTRIVEQNPHFRSDTVPFYMDANNAGYPDVRVLINDIRTANAVQVMLERNARGGTRYTELVRSHFGVVSPDARLQRPEYLGGGRSPITINPIAQTSETTANGVLGELAATGTVMGQHRFSGSFTEHGYILGLVSVRADLSYQNGINRLWHRRTQYDFYWPGLAHLGEQAIMSHEIYADGSANDLTVFGYQERWSEYKYKPSIVSGAFRSSSAAPLDVWHLAENFGSRPVLNDVFIVEQPPVDRVLQVATTFGEQVLLDAFFDATLVRAMPMHSIPGLGPRL